MRPDDDIARYLRLTKERPELFTHSDLLPLCLDEKELRAFAARTGRPMGIVYDNSPFWLVLADLCTSAKGFYSYGRVVYCGPTNGSVALVRRRDRETFGLLRVFRHGCRAMSLEIPRGFHELPGLTPEENVRRELSQELGIPPETCQVTRLGQVRADAGLSGGAATVFLADIDENTKIVPGTGEGIQCFEWYSEAELRQAIWEGRITDGFTLSAYALYQTRPE